VDGTKLKYRPVALNAMFRDDHLANSDPCRLSPVHPHFDEIMLRHRDAMADALPTYRDPVSGFAVFTAAFLADRGDCCDSGCRHCPFVAPHP